MLLLGAVNFSHPSEETQTSCAELVLRACDAFHQEVGPQTECSRSQAARSLRPTRTARCEGVRYLY